MFFFKCLVNVIREITKLNISMYGPLVARSSCEDTKAYSLLIGKHAINARTLEAWNFLVTDPWNSQVIGFAAFLDVTRSSLNVMFTITFHKLQMWCLRAWLKQRTAESMSGSSKTASFSGHRHEISFYPKLRKFVNLRITTNVLINILYYAVTRVCTF